jgi:hypothetical protein
MNGLKYLLILSCVLFIIGCPARSIFPLFGAKDLTFNADLLGTWVDKDNEQYTFQKLADQEHTVIYLSKDGETIAYKVQLGELRNSWFLDSYPASKTNDYHLLPTHVISKMDLLGDTLRIASLEGDYFKEMVHNVHMSIPHVFQENDLVLTGTTDEIQQLIFSLAENKAAFPDTTTFIRRR